MCGRLGLFLNDETGAVAIEYALIAVIISVAIYSSVAKIAPILNTIFNSVSSTLTTAVTAK